MLCDILLDMYHYYKLLQKYMSAGCLHPSRQSCILCLSSMAQSEREDTEYTFLEYTEKGFVLLIVVDYFMLVMRYSRFFVNWKSKYECFYRSW